MWNISVLLKAKLLVEEQFWIGTQLSHTIGHWICSLQTVPQILISWWNHQSRENTGHSRISYTHLWPESSKGKSFTQKLLIRHACIFAKRTLSIYCLVWLLSPDRNWSLIVLGIVGGEKLLPALLWHYKSHGHHQERMVEVPKCQVLWRGDADFSPTRSAQWNTPSLLADFRFQWAVRRDGTCHRQL